MKYFNIGYKSANYYLIDAGQYCLAIDVGWPGTINDYGRQLRPTGKRVQDINYLIVTHFHVDHAGLAQELKNQGIKLVLFDVQLRSICQMENMIQKKMDYKPINLEDNIVITLSFFLDSGDAFIG